MVRWTALVVSGGTVTPVDLPSGRPAVVGSGAGVEISVFEAPVAPKRGNSGPLQRWVSLAARDDGVAVEVLREGRGALLNDVQLSGPALIHPGDELTVGSHRMVFVRLPAASPGRGRLVSLDELVARLDEELARAQLVRPVGLVVVAQAALNVAARQALARRVVEDVSRSGATAFWGELTGDLLAGVIPELGKAALEAVLGRLPQVAGPRAKVAVADAPRDGLDADALLEAAYCRLAGTEPQLERSPVLLDPAMVRLASVAASLEGGRGPVLAVGPPGSGRATLLSCLAPKGAAVAYAADSEGVERALRSPGGTVVLRELGALSPAAAEVTLRRAEERGLRVLATSTGRLAKVPAILEVPPLRARPDDVLPLATQFLTQARLERSRSRLVLGAEARQLLLSYRWPGNVRELKNVMTRAARASVRDEVGRDALPLRLGVDSPAESLRGALKAAERELLLEALARTRWNVSAAALRLGLPRRTVVYRMARLGLKRPSR